MTTITIDQDLGAKNLSFRKVRDLLSYLEEMGGFIFLHELPEEECTPALKKKAKEAIKRYEEDPSSFADL